MPHESDIDLSSEDIGGLSSADALAGFFTTLGYPTGCRKELTPTSQGIGGDTAEDIRKMELLAEDEDGFFRVMFVKLRSITARARNDLCRNLGKRNVDHLLVLAGDFDTLEFVLIDKKTRQRPGPGGQAGVQIIPRVVAVNRKTSTLPDRRILRRLTWTFPDGLAQFDKLRTTFEAAHFASQYYQNRALFADHFLDTRLREVDAWKLNPADAFQKTREIMRDAGKRWGGQPEQALRDELFDPMWKMLGFKAKVQKKAEDDLLEPDYTLKAKDGAPLTAAFVYRWDRWLDGPDLNDPDTPEENPGAAVVSALTEGKARWIIVTNGRMWRLYSREAHSRATNFYEVDLEEALAVSGETDPNEAFRYWWLFFRAEAFADLPDRDPPACWLDEIVRGSRDYAKQLGERLKDRIFMEVFPHLADGFLTDRRKRLGTRKAPTDDELSETYEATLTLLYRILFLLYAEARDLLPIRESTYLAVSLKRIKEEIAAHAGTSEEQVPDRLKEACKDTDYDLYDRLQKLFGVMDKGDAECNVPCYNGGLFVTEPDGSARREHRIARFLNEHKVPDRHLALAIDRLARDPDDTTCGLVSIDYKSLEVRHLGSIYEGLLEFKLKIAAEDLAVTKEKKREKFIPLAQAKKGRKKAATAVVGQGEVYLSNDKAERKATGSYYTPDPIVEYIVEHTVGPVLEEKLDALRPELNEAAKTYRRHLANAQSNPAIMPDGAEPRAFAAEKTYAGHQDLVEKVFDLKVLDPAMGSGHFLVEAVDYITDRLLDFLNRFPHNPVSTALDRMRASILEALVEQGIDIGGKVADVLGNAKNPWIAKLTDIHLLKRHVLKRCIYGVDLNPMAVELAKVSLWLDAFTLGAPLSFLDHHLRCGNSLVGEVEIREHVLPGSQRAEDLSLAVHNILRISASADANPGDVETNKKLFADVSRIVGPFKNRLHVETGCHFIDVDTPTRDRIIRYPYDSDFDPDKPPKNQERSHAAYLQVLDLAAEMRFFHWELEFPEVYFDFAEVSPKKDEASQKRFQQSLARRIRPTTGIDTVQRKLKHKDDIHPGSAGFDAIIGNPPYVRQEAIKPFKDYFKARYDTYNSTNDLYIYFQEQEVRNLRAGGRMGMIVANKWMRAGYGEKLRSFLRRVSRPLELIDFGHSPIFPDADTFPCIPIVARRDRAVPAHDDLSDGEIMHVCTVPREHWDEGMDLGAFTAARRYSIPTRLLRDEGWSMEDPGVQALLEKIRNTGVPLTEYCGSPPVYGVKTGLNEAFYIDAPTRQRLIREDPRSEEIIKPLLRGRDIDRWRPRPSNMYLIFTRRGIDIDRYPAVKRHVAQYRQRLEPKPRDWSDRQGQWPGRAAGDYKWYELQASPGDDFERALAGRKILYQEIQFHSWFALETEGAFINNKAFLLPTDDLALLGVLCSPLMWWQLTRTLPHMKDEALSPAGFLMENLSINVGSKSQADHIRGVVEPLVELADQYHAWELETMVIAVKQFHLEAVDERLLNWLPIPAEIFVRRMTKLTEGKRMKDGIAKAMTDFQGRAREQQLDLLHRQLEMEMHLATLVEDAYGLTSEERELLHATRPIRDPLDVLEGRVRQHLLSPDEEQERSIEYG